MGEDNNMIDILITESKAGDLHNIEASSAHIYAHLMKFVAVRPISKTWISTINEQCEQLAGINNASYWREVMNSPIRMEKIKRWALDEYEKGGNKNAEVQFNIIHNDFYDITKFKNKDILKNYMLNHLDPIEDQDIIDHINKQLK